MPGRRRAHLPLLALAFALVLAPTVSVHGDAVVVTKAAAATTIAEVFVEADRVRVALEIGVTDLPAFRNLLPDPIHERLGLGSVPLAERLPRFFTEDWKVLADGEPLPGHVTHLEGRPRIRRDPITGEGLPAGPEEEVELVLAAVVEFPFSKPPATLTLLPPRPSEAGDRAASIGFITWHQGVAVTDYRYLSAEQTVDLDWDDPFYSRFRNRNLKRQYDAPISAFLYVDAYEVRKEIVARPKDLQHWVDLGLAGTEVIPIEAQGKLKERVAAFLAEHCAVTIDGVSIAPVLDRIHFVRRTLRTTGVVDPPEALPVTSATLGVIFAYPIDGLPQEARLTWDLWSDRVRQIPAAATDEAGPMPALLTPEDPVLHWQNFLKKPRATVLETIPEPAAPSRFSGAGAVVVLLLVGLLLGVGGLLGGRVVQRRPGRGWWVAGGALVLVGLAIHVAGVFDARRGGALDAVEAEPVVQGLLTNVYRAFDVRGEGRIYDALARSVEGDLLTRVYLETLASLELANQGGARVKVEDVALASVSTAPVPEGRGFEARTRWQVRGAVGHWGHIHRRTNAYDAKLTIRPVDGAWRITDLEVIGEERR